MTLFTLLSAMNPTTSCRILDCEGNILVLSISAKAHLFIIDCLLDSTVEHIEFFEEICYITVDYTPQL